VEVVAQTVVAAVATVTNEYREPRGHVTLTSKHYDKSPVKPSFQHLPTGLTASKHSADAAATSSQPSLTPLRHYYTMRLMCIMYNNIVCVCVRARDRRPPFTARRPCNRSCSRLTTI